MRKKTKRNFFYSAVVVSNPQQKVRNPRSVEELLYFSSRDINLGIVTVWYVQLSVATPGIWI